MNVLIVDDEPLILQEVALWMQQMGWDTDECSDAYIAIGKLQVKEYDLIISDLLMTGMSGIALYRYIRLKYNTPILIMTCYDVDKVKNMGFAYVWYKDGKEKFDQILNKIIEG